jgi:hypothetical protein
VPLHRRRREARRSLEGAGRTFPPRGDCRKSISTDQDMSPLNKEKAMLRWSVLRFFPLGLPVLVAAIGAGWKW